MPSDFDTQRRIIVHSVLTGLSPFVPVPFADDLLANFVRRRLVSRLAEERGLTLDAASIAHLAWEPERHRSMVRRAGGLLLWPVKKILRTLFLALEIKRAVDLASAVYHRGVLVDGLLGDGRIAPAGPLDAAVVGPALDAVLAERSVGPVEVAFRVGLDQSKGALRSAVGLLRDGVSHLSRDAAPREIEHVVEEVRSKEEPILAGIVEKLQTRLAAVPDDYFAELRRRLDARLPSA